VPFHTISNFRLSPDDAYANTGGLLIADSPLAKAAPNTLREVGHLGRIHSRTRQTHRLSLHADTGYPEYQAAGLGIAIGHVAIAVRGQPRSVVAHQR